MAHRRRWPLRWTTTGHGGQQADDWAYRRDRGDGAGCGSTYDGDGGNSVRVAASIVSCRGCAAAQVEGCDFQNGRQPKRRGSIVVVLYVYMVNGKDACVMK